tara:strand:+ start:1046 stop:1981 length:936 start_codon:yes stop_codon:yes gene_type:complete
MGNQRVFYACQGVCYNGKPVEGVQSITLNTSQQVVDIPQFGSLTIHKNVPNYPVVNITMTRVLTSGSGPLYSGTLLENINKHNNYICLFVGEDTKNFIHESTATENVYITGVSINSVNYNFGTDGFFTEELGFLAYYKELNNCPVNKSIFQDMHASGTGTMQRQHLLVESSNIGSGLIPSGSRIQSVSCQANFNIQNINEFGSNLSNPTGAFRYAVFPVDTNISVEILSSGEFDLFNIDPNDSATHMCGNTILNYTTGIPLSFKLCGGYTLDCGTGILMSTDYGGGSVDGDNATTTLNFKSQNALSFTQDI